MKVLVAGATGTIGVPLVRALLAAGHQVYGLTRRPHNRQPLASLGAEPVVADALDRDALLAAVDGLSADAVIHQVTALKRPPARHRDMAQTNTLRTRGTAHLLEAANTIGAHRFVTQSMVFGYGYGHWGDHLLTERDRFAPPGRGRFEQHLAAMRSAEQQTFTIGGIQGVALRYGLFYGPGGAIEGLIDLLAVRGWLARLHRDGAVTPTTIAKAYRLLRRILAVAVQAGYLPRNLCIVTGAGVERARGMRHLSVPEPLRLAGLVPDRYRPWRPRTSARCCSRPAGWRTWGGDRGADPEVPPGRQRLPPSNPTGCRAPRDPARQGRRRRPMIFAPEAQATTPHADDPSLSPSSARRVAARSRSVASTDCGCHG
jgi:nucleoside-diphosphate-sugar epimerase